MVIPGEDKVPSAGKPGSELGDTSLWGFLLPWQHPRQEAMGGKSCVPHRLSHPPTPQPHIQPSLSVCLD